MSRHDVVPKINRNGPTKGRAFAVCNPPAKCTLINPFWLQCGSMLLSCVAAINCFVKICQLVCYDYLSDLIKQLTLFFYPGTILQQLY